MKTSYRLAAFFSILTAALFVFASDAAAQGRYANQYSRADVDTIIRNVEDRSDEFRRDFNNELNNSGLSSSQRRTYSQQVENFENATDRLRSRFDSDNSWWQSRTQVQTVVNNAQPLNTTMNSIAFRRRIERQWNQLRNAINRLADTYDLPGIAGGGWNGGPWNPGGGGGGDNGPTSRPPSWAVGTFYSTNSYDNIQLTINANGRVTVVNNGQTYYGRYNNGRMYLNNDTSTITRRGDGIRTFNINSRQTTDYTRNYGGGGGGDESGPTSNPPNWARGTFFSRNGPDDISMTISNNGRVTVVNNGQTYYGRFYNGQIYLNNDVSDVSRNGNGIRTYNRNSGQTTIYRRN